MWVCPGTFPYELNNAEQLAKPFFEEGGKRFPPLKHFHPANLKPKAREKLESWWAEENARYESDPSLRYVVWDQLVAYCKNDVEILRKCNLHCGILPPL